MRRGAREADLHRIDRNKHICDGMLVVREIDAVAKEVAGSGIKVSPLSQAIEQPATPARERPALSRLRPTMASVRQWLPLSAGTRLVTLLPSARRCCRDVQPSSRQFA